MKLLLNTTFKDLDGNDMKDESGRVMTVKDALKIAVTGELPEDTQGGGQQAIETKMRNFDIYLKIREARDEVDLTPEEIVHLKPRIAKIFHVLVVGPLLKSFAGS